MLAAMAKKKVPSDLSLIVKLRPDDADTISELMQARGLRRRSDAIRQAIFAEAELASAGRSAKLDQPGRRQVDPHPIAVLVRLNGREAAALRAIVEHHDCTHSQAVRHAIRQEARRAKLARR